MTHRRHRPITQSHRRTPLTHRPTPKPLTQLNLILRGHRIRHLDLEPRRNEHMSSSHTHEPTRVRVTDWGRTADDGTTDFLLVEQQIDRERRPPREPEAPQEVQQRRRTLKRQQGRLRKKLNKITRDLTAAQAELDSLHTPEGIADYSNAYRDRQIEIAAERERIAAERTQRELREGAARHLVDLADAFEMLPPFLFIGWERNVRKKTRLKELGYITELPHRPGHPHRYRLRTPKTVADMGDRLYPNGLPA